MKKISGSILEESAGYIKIFRLKLLLTQTDMAELCGIPVSTLKSWENGYSLPSLNNFSKLMKFCESNNIKFREYKEFYLKSKITK